MTLELSPREQNALNRLAAQQDMSKAKVMRQALRLYQHVARKQAEGQKMAFVKDGEVVIQEIIGLPAVD